jgi:outer membrane protein TolC
MKKVPIVSAAAAAVCMLLAPAPVHAGPDSESSKEVITLEQAYDRTLATDQSIRIAQYEIRRANLLPWSALTRLGPSLTGNSSYQNSQTVRSRSSSGDPLGSGSRLDNESRRAGVTFQQPLLDLTVFPAYRLGKLSARAAKLQ